MFFLCFSFLCLLILYPFLFLYPFFFFWYKERLLKLIFFNIFFADTSLFTFLDRKKMINNHMYPSEYRISIILVINVKIFDFTLNETSNKRACRFVRMNLCPMFYCFSPIKILARSPRDFYNQLRITSGHLLLCVLNVRPHRTINVFFPQRE